MRNVVRNSMQALLKCYLTRLPVGLDTVRFTGPTDLQFEIKTSNMYVTGGFHRNVPWSFLFSCFVPSPWVPLTGGCVEWISCVNVKCTLTCLPWKNPVKDKHLHTHISMFLSALICMAAIIYEEKRSVVLLFRFFFLQLRRRNGILVGSLFVTWGPCNQQTGSTLIFSRLRPQGKLLLL